MRTKLAQDAVQLSYAGAIPAMILSIIHFKHSYLVDIKIMRTAEYKQY